MIEGGQRETERGKKKEEGVAARWVIGGLEG